MPRFSTYVRMDTYQRYIQEADTLEEARQIALDDWDCYQRPEIQPTIEIEQVDDDTPIGDV